MERELDYGKHQITVAAAAPIRMRISPCIGYSTLTRLIAPAVATISALFQLKLWLSRANTPEMTSPRLARRTTRTAPEYLISAS
jgi:hypothetical protein